MSQAIVSLDALRARIRELEGSPVRQERVPSGIASMDQLVDGLPTPGILEISGPVGSGRTRLVLAIAAAFTARGQPVAWVDPRRRLFPPAAAALGVDLERVLIVQPPADREAWSVEQIARSGVFALVVVSDPTEGSRGAVGQRWAHAAEVGRCTLAVLAERPIKHLPACVRIGIPRERLVVLRDRNGIPGATTGLPPLSSHADPWA